jgi:hypothetical protein
MKQIQAFEANDGTLFRDAESARRHEKIKKFRELKHGDLFAEVKYFAGDAAMAAKNDGIFLKVAGTSTCVRLKSGLQLPAHKIEDEDEVFIVERDQIFKEGVFDK